MFKYSVILAGGLGTRMRPLTNYIPKALIRVNDKSLIDYNKEQIFLSNIENVFVTYNYLSTILFDELRNSVDAFINTTNQDNAYFLFNTFIQYINEPILVMPCDIIMEIDYTELFNDYKKNGSPAIMIVGTRALDDIAGDYITYDDYNVIESLSRDEISPFYASGLQVINPLKLNKLIKNETNFYNVWNKLMGTTDLKLSTIHPKSWMAYDNIKQVI